MDELILELCGGAKLALPPTLRSMTTYVLLEQEAWFEKECRFVSAWLKPGMTVIDIGANLGVYTIAAARSVGPEGFVYAYEPAVEPRRFLEQSRDANGLTNLTIIGSALSDTVRSGVLFHGASSELNSLSGSGEGEDVAVTTLDSENAARGWPSPDFVKIDAEGEEARILAGANAFFHEHAPLVMFEIKAGDKVNLDLAARFIALGYGIYRQIAGAPILVPFSNGEMVDAFELNLFAVKPQRADQLAREGFLIETFSDWTPDGASHSAALTFPASLPFGSAFAPLFDDRAVGDREYREALSGMAVWRNPAQPLGLRVAALRFAEKTLDTICRTRPTLARLSTLARASSDLGKRMQAVHALHAMAETLSRGDANLSEPFWPANPRFDHIDPRAKQRDWFIGGTMEQLVRAERHSSLFGPPLLDFSRMAENSFVSRELVRRGVLRQILASRRPAIPQTLCEKSEDHLNAEIWRSGKVPGL